MISKIIPEESIHLTQKAIDKADNIVIISHINPDGDALGSSLGLYHFLFSQGKQTRVIMPNAFPSFLSFLPNSGDILIYEDYQDEAIDLIETANLIFCLDFNQLKRTGDLGEIIGKSKAAKILIDHHPFPDTFANITMSHPEIASTSELIFRLICRMGSFTEMNLPSAECICTGILTDTGALSYNSNSPEIYTIVAELIKKGVDKDKLYKDLYNTNSVNRMQLMGYLLSQKMKLYPEYQTAIIALTQEVQVKYNHKKGDSEGFVNLPLSIKDIHFSIFVKEDTDYVKMSFRSQGNFPTNTFASRYFNGGGHLNASGGESHLTIDETLSRIESVLPAFFAEWVEANKQDEQE
ncbi:MAG: bifunctional oligoribonuclease/PAP phosphatase NrnA [Paludibacteraceae bacterium]|nr:bifunctional oligoribonuclease/PAP phosphatase NrnA [Paludibacteraceae bacterium]MBP6283914.1 bifunctional oligoribonuclease/PAP phosphatase NrnA [Paludibacteraceae bacterium]